MLLLLMPPRYPTPTITISGIGNVVNLPTSSPFMATAKVDADYSPSLDDCFIGVITTNKSIKITLPRAHDGKTYTIKDISGYAHTHKIKIINKGLIDLATSVSISDNFGSLTLTSLNGSWSIIGASSLSCTTT